MIEEALAAARDLSSDPALQIEIAAGLMGISEDEIRPHVPPAPSARRAQTTIAVAAGRRSVIVERKPLRRVAR